MTVFHCALLTCCSTALRLSSKSLSAAVPSVPTADAPPAPGTGEAPPTPAGATRLSGSLRLQEVVARLCDTDSDFVEVKVSS